MLASAPPILKISIASNGYAIVREHKGNGGTHNPPIRVGGPLGLHSG